MTAITRRDAIKRAALLIGGTLALPDILKAWGDLTIENQSFTLRPGQAEILAEICETIVPKTKTPGAKEAGVPAFIQKIVADCYEPDQRTKFWAGIDAVEAHTRKVFDGKGFVDITDANRAQVLRHFESEHHANKDANPWWRTMKDLAVVGFFTSEIGCTQALRYEPIPGRYDGAFPYKKGDKAWA
jgi:hypothetical protein